VQPLATKEAVVVDIQRFSLHDGPGIRTTVFFKGCVLRCRWCQNPEALRHSPEMSFYAERCVGSGQCAEVCEHHAIDLSSPVRIDWERCTSCGSCAEACVHGAIRVVGQRYSVEALEHELMKDEGFYADSGGGVTLSGGEPMLHAQYLSLLLPRLKERGVHVTMETCGKFAWSRMEPLVESLDLVYFDFKHMDSAKHRELTGQGNEAILANFTRLAEAPVTLVARMPVIPGCNDDAANVKATATFLRANGHDALHCLGYHHLGEAKRSRLRPLAAPFQRANLTEVELEETARAFEREGIRVVLYD
jgi:pyruvate formate lyase activating enzyme